MPRSITILGPVPPPFGGVSVHIVRIAEVLSGQGVEVEIIPYTGLTRRSRPAKAIAALQMIGRIHGHLRPGRSCDLLHIHYGGMVYFLALAPLLETSRCRLVITFHSVRVLQDLAHLPSPIRRYALHLLSRCSLFVCVRPGIAEELAKGGLGGIPITVMPAFLPPSNRETDLSRLPADLGARMEERRRRGWRQICSAAYYLGGGYGQDDLYGIELLADALTLLDDRLDGEVALYVMVSNPPDTESRRRAERRLRDQALRWRHIVLELHYGIPLVPVLARCCGFLRLSREDGDSVAIREALAFGIPVLASDVVQRPEGVETLPLGRADQLAPRIERFLLGLTPWDAPAPRPIRPHDDTELQAFCRQLLGSGAG